MAEDSGWQLSETAAANYERYMVPAHCLHRAQNLIDRVCLRPAEKVLDVGCGTGVVSRFAARRVGGEGKVTGVDLNPSMLTVAREVTTYFEPPIEFLEGSAEDLPVPDSFYDVALSQQALMFFSDRQKALKEVFRALKPDGRIALSVWREEAYNPVYEQLIEALNELLGDEIAAIMRSPFVTRSAGEVRDLLRDAGFKNIRVAIDVLSVRFPSVAEFVWQEIESMPLKNVQNQMSQAQQALTDEMVSRLVDFVDDYGIVCPCQDYVVIASK